jgi:hypothetical protein
MIRDADLVKWLSFLHIETCTCPYQYKNLGILHGTSMGKGWVRMDTADDCPVHKE